MGTWEFFSLYQDVLAFESKLEFFTHDIESGHVLHFETLQAIRENSLTN